MVRDCIYHRSWLEPMGKLQEMVRECRRFTGDGQSLWGNIYFELGNDVYPAIYRLTYGQGLLLIKKGDNIN